MNFFDPDKKLADFFLIRIKNFQIFFPEKKIAVFFYPDKKLPEFFAIQFENQCDFFDPDQKCATFFNFFLIQSEKKKLSIFSEFCSKIKYD